MGIQIYQGNCLDLLDNVADESVDAIITDPPYSSGGLHAGSRKQMPSRKYEASCTINKREDFLGDNKDQRSWTLWSSYWMEQVLAKLKPGGYLLSFSDWRQLPASTDAMQIAGVIWRGVIAWDKGPASRAPHKGYFRHQAEYIVWGSKGALPIATHAGPYPGVIKVPVNPREKYHLTGKPVELMVELVKIVPPGGTVFDPFMGSASTGVACQQVGLNFIGMELTQHYYEVSQKRLNA